MSLQNDPMLHCRVPMLPNICWCGLIGSSPSHVFIDVELWAQTKQVRSDCEGEHYMSLCERCDDRVRAASELFTTNNHKGLLIKIRGGGKD